MEEEGREVGEAVRTVWWSGKGGGNGGKERVAEKKTGSRDRDRGRRCWEGAST
jgi:hypothetical protein